MARLEDTSGGREVMPTDSATSRMVSVDQREVIAVVVVVVVVVVGGGEGREDGFEIRVLEGCDRELQVGNVVVIARPLIQYSTVQ